MTNDTAGKIPPSVTVELPSPTERCSCGKVHPIAVEKVVIDETALASLAEYMSDEHWRSPFVVMDTNTADVIGSSVLVELRRGGVAPKYFSYNERSGLLADEHGVTRLETALRSGSSDVLIAVGSGVITDLTRYVAHRLGLPFISVPTAASMDGYASGVAAMEFRGMKATSTAIAPRGIFADPLVIANAPFAMTQSGVGDLLGKASAHIDWRLAHGLFSEELCEEIERRVAEPMIEVATHVDEIASNSVSGTAQLLKGLVESGIAMAMAGNSRPASGCEHHASHFWDMLAQRGLHQHAPHGLQVGFATHFAIRLQRWALADGRSLPPSPSRMAEESEEARSWFLGHADQVDVVLAEKESFRSSHVSEWPANRAEWDLVRVGTSPERDRATIVDHALDAIGIPFEVGFLGLDAPTIAATFRFANRIRARYTVIDLLESQDLLDEAVASVMDEVGRSISP